MPFHFWSAAGLMYVPPLFNIYMKLCVRASTGLAFGIHSMLMIPNYIFQPEASQGKLLRYLSQGLLHGGLDGEDLSLTYPTKTE